MNKIMIATTIEQSEHLLELGLNPDTADMFYGGDILIATHYITKTENEILTPGYKGAIPAWSLSALLELIPEIPNCTILLAKNKGTFGMCITPLDSGLALADTNECTTPLDAAYQMTCWLLENKYI